MTSKNSRIECTNDGFQTERPHREEPSPPEAREDGE